MSAEKSDGAVGAAPRKGASHDGREAANEATTADRRQLSLLDAGPPATTLPDDFDPVRDRRAPAAVPAGPDRQRLAQQLERVLAVMADHAWRSLREISDAAEAPEASASARLRELRAAGQRVERRRRFGQASGTFEYRLAPAVP